MVWRHLLLVAIAVLPISLADDGPSDCTNWQCGTIGVGTDDDTVIIDGSQTTPGNGTDPGDSNTGGGFNGPNQEPECQPVEIADGRCQGWAGDPPPEVTRNGPVTITDIAAFRPTPPLQNSQPQGWALVGLDANFVATAQRHVVAGELFGLPADVRFTPYRFAWDFGDGHTRTTDTGGASWAKLRLAEFDPTPTSHVYRASGRYSVGLDVGYVAEYRINGSPWVPVVGTLTIPAPDAPIVVGTAKTVLVDDDCLANPSGPGC